MAAGRWSSSQPPSTSRWAAAALLAHPRVVRLMRRSYDQTQPGSRTNPATPARVRHARDRFWVAIPHRFSGHPEPELLAGEDWTPETCALA